MVIAHSFISYMITHSFLACMHIRHNDCLAYLLAAISVERLGNDTLGFSTIINHCLGNSTHKTHRAATLKKARVNIHLRGDQAPITINERVAIIC